jgi:hypothetical protein
MRMKIVLALFAAATVVTGASAMLAAPEQTTITPGQMTQAKVWVQNRGANEAVPVDLRDSTVANPLRVEVVGGAPGRPANPVVVRVVRELWQYESVLVKPDQDPASALSQAANTGWETTGITFNRPDGVLLLLKRPR